VSTGATTNPADFGMLEMLEMSAAAGSAHVSANQDSGLRCPKCEYNLTGLIEPRCPECGAAFDWSDPRLRSVYGPAIAFERARGWRKIPAFLRTWLTVLLAPWVFARQVVKHVSVRHGVAFAAVCFGATAAGGWWQADTPFMLTWLTTALIFIVLQAIVLSILDPNAWRGAAPAAAALRFWLLAGCYTSAVMPTEVIAGPPLICTNGSPNAFAIIAYPITDWLDFWPASNGGQVTSLACWSQYVIWAAGITCCCYARIRRRAQSVFVALLSAGLALAAALAVYGMCVEYIGVGWLYERVFGALPYTGCGTFGSTW
jgi:hypothetical protein